MLQPGNLYKHPDGYLCRIIASDDFEVLYDTQTENGDWAFGGSPKGPCYYYRTLPAIVSGSWTESGLMPFTKQEIDLLGTNLPLRLCRNQDVQWLNTEVKDFGEFNKTYKLSSKIVLNCSTVQLAGINSSKRPMKAQLLNSTDPKGFTEAELIWQANNIQAPYVKKTSRNGIGLFRLGHEKNIPSYYIGGYIDLAGFLNLVK